MELGTKFEVLLIRYGMLPKDRQLFCYKTFENSIEVAENEEIKKAVKHLKGLKR